MYPALPVEVDILTAHDIIIYIVFGYIIILYIIVPGRSPHWLTAYIHIYRNLCAGILCRKVHNTQCYNCRNDDLFHNICILRNE